MRISRAGAPATTEFALTSHVTTLPLSGSARQSHGVGGFHASLVSGRLKMVHQGFGEARHRFDLADVAPKDASPEATGLDKPTRLNATTFDGLSYMVRIGKLEGDNYYVSFEQGGTLAKAAKPDDAERIKKIEERLPKDKALSSQVLLIPKSRLEDTLKKRDELIEKREAGKK